MIVPMLPDLKIPFDRRTLQIQGNVSQISRLTSRSEPATHSSSSHEAMSSYLFQTRSDVTQKKPGSSEEQQRKIDDVRSLLGDLPTEMPSFLSDGTIRRFLRARNWSTGQAAKALKEAVKWRRQFKPEMIFWEDLAENDVRRAYIPDYLDKSGRTVVVTASIKSLSSTKERIKQLVYNLENLAMMNSEDAQDDNIVWLCNFQGWTLSCTPLRETRESLHILQNYYPGLIRTTILSDPPKIFESFWKIVKHFVEPTLQDRVKFVYSNNSESQRMMANMFDMDKLQSAFGGRNTATLDISKYAERMRTRDQLRRTRLASTQTANSDPSDQE